MTTMHWFSFNELSREDLYEILRVRQEVFTVEQNCAYQDADGLDQSAWHLMLRQPGPTGQRLVAYLRVLPPASRFREPSIGRLLTIPAVRRTGLARIIMLEALNLDRQCSIPGCRSASQPSTTGALLQQFGFLCELRYPR